MIKISKTQHEANIKDNIERFNNMPPEMQEELNKSAEMLRAVFGRSMNWNVWGEDMVAWDDLPETNRHHSMQHLVFQE